jgi:hypothetical protein
VLITVTFASVTIAPDWSVTRTTIVDVFGDCAAAAIVARRNATVQLTTLTNSPTRQFANFIWG